MPEVAIGEPHAFLLGSPRSGTTWMAKIFDSHPDVFYLHEPDIVLRRPEIPHLPAAGSAATSTAAVRLYIEQLCRLRKTRALGSLPLFPKTYRPGLTTPLFNSLIYGGHAVEKLLGYINWHRNIEIPFVFSKKRRPAFTLIKSVSSLGRAELFRNATRDTKIVHIVRHPAAQIASRLRGSRMGVLDGDTFVRQLARTTVARLYGLSEDVMRTMSLEGRMACQWLITNTLVHDALAADARYRLLIYEDLCRDPSAVSRELLAWCGLGWTAQTEDFVNWSTRGGGERFFGVVRSSAAEVGKWRHLLDARQIADITGVVERTAFGRSVLERTA
jgi:hypothetical protein